LLFFNVHKSQKPEYEFFKTVFAIGRDPVIDLRRWKRLLDLDFGTTNNVNKMNLVTEEIGEAHLK
jgi:hypothetical protein